MGRDVVIDQIRRASNLVALLVVAAVFACACVHVIATLAIYATLLLQGQPMPINPGILAGAMWLGAMQGASALPVVLVLGFMLHTLLLRSGLTRLFITWVQRWLSQASHYWCTCCRQIYLAQSPFWIMGAASGVLAGCLFWLIRRPDRDAVSASPTP